LRYSGIAPEDWERELQRIGLPEHLTRRLVTMAELNRAGRYDLMAACVERVTGRPAGDEQPGFCWDSGKTIEVSG
jgi:hypothetical protein